MASKKKTSETDLQVPSTATQISARNRGVSNLKPFKKGVSGNPGGRPKIPEDIKQAFRDMTPTAIAKLKEMIESPSTRDADRIRAIDIVLDRGLGKPSQEVSMDVKSTPTVIFTGMNDVRD